MCVDRLFRIALVFTMLTCVKTCSPGEFLDENNLCRLCWAGTYKNDDGDQACSACQRDSTSEIGSKFTTDCMCNSGYSSGYSPNTCSACERGKYKDSSGNVVCNSCMPGKYSTTTAARSINTCQQCRQHSASVEANGAATGCICNAGYSGQFSHSCTACEAGKYKDTNANMNCHLCAPGSFSTAIAATSSDTCQICSRTHHTSAAGSDSPDDCVCNVGYSGTDTCTACVRGKYKAFIGNGVCDSCMSGKYSLATAARADNECRSCRTNSFSAEASDSRFDCICNAGY